MVKLKGSLLSGRFGISPKSELLLNHTDPESVLVDVIAVLIAETSNRPFN